MSNPEYENAIAVIMKQIKKGNEKMKDSTLKTYTRMVRKMYARMVESGLDTDIQMGLPKCIFVPADILKEIETSWAVRDSTKKNMISLMLSMCKGGAEEYPHGSGFEDMYKEYRKAFDIIKASNEAKQIKQEPTEKEGALQNIKFDELKRGLSYHFNKVRKLKADDIESAMLNMIGHIHIDQVLRNECATMLMSREYLEQSSYPKTNFIWVKGRNHKLLVIRDNKVRNADRGDEPKEVYLKGAVNTAINKYISVLANNDKVLGQTHNDRMPLIHSNKWEDGECITSSHYSQIFKKVWSKYDEDITTTSIRKIYAMDVREKYKGNLVKEKEACEKLDHSQDTHNKHYILHFD
jgi:hypothetical protein